MKDLDNRGGRPINRDLTAYSPRMPLAIRGYGAVVRPTYGERPAWCVVGPASRTSHGWLPLAHSGLTHETPGLPPHRQPVDSNVCPHRRGEWIPPTRTQTVRRECRQCIDSGASPCSLEECIPAVKSSRSRRKRKPCRLGLNCNHRSPLRTCPANLAGGGTGQDGGVGTPGDPSMRAEAAQDRPGPILSCGLARRAPTVNRWGNWPDAPIGPGRSPKEVIRER